MPKGSDSTTAVRRAEFEDAANLARLRWIWRTSERGERGLSEPEFETAFAEWWSAHEASHTAFIAESAGRPVGMAWLAIFDRVPHPRRLDRQAGSVQSVFVLEEHRNRGIGWALIAAVVAEAHARGVGYLIVHPSERAYPLYERFGFVETNASCTSTSLHASRPRRAPDRAPSDPAARSRPRRSAASRTSGARTVHR